VEPSPVLIFLMINRNPKIELNLMNITIIELGRSALKRFPESKFESMITPPKSIVL